jgi:hypothetical protein
MVASEAEVARLIGASLFELNGRHLNDMLPGVIPSVAGVAHWLWERLALHFRMYEVTVWQDDLAASIRRS